MTTNNCCAECGKEEGDGGVSLKACKSCMQVRYCNAACQHKHWLAHKKACKQRAAELRDEALFKDPPPKEDCPICFLPVPISDFAIANQELAYEVMAEYYPCCGKKICRGCIYSFYESGNAGKCPFCNSDRSNKLRKSKLQK